MSHLLRLLLVSLLLVSFSCSPEGPASSENNTNNTNNLNNANNVNNFNNSNNLNNTNNVNNLNNLNNTNNTVGPQCGTSGGVCEWWQECSEQNVCVTAAGYCADGNDCGAYERCPASHMCERDDPASCGFTYHSDFPSPVSGALKMPGTLVPRSTEPLAGGEIDHGPWPSGYTTLSRLSGVKLVSVDDLIMPDYSDNMPLFSRARDFAGVPRCYETPTGARLLFEDEAYDLYVSIIETTTGATVNKTPQFRTVIGLRGAYPGIFEWNHNSPDFFNDTMVLLWKESNGEKRVKEFPVNTDTGDNTYTSTSSLLPNRLYKYVNGTHRGYNALAMYEWNYDRIYHTADDANANGHWDNDRNGWLNTASTVDFVRVGSAHNIHMGSVSAPLGTARVAGWSAGCQVHPGMANWTEFITNAWTASGATADYFLVDTRDINLAVWGAPCTPDGSHDCPFTVNSFPFNHSDTTTGGGSQFDYYGCSTANESGPEKVYELRIASHGTLTATVDCTGSVDVDVHLLSIDDPNACLTRAHISFDFDVVPGRYLLVVDSFVSGTTSLDGAYTLHLTLN